MAAQWLKVMHPADFGLIDFAALWIYPPSAKEPLFEPDPPEMLPS